MDQPTEHPPELVLEHPAELRLLSALVLLIGLSLFLALPFVLKAASVVFLPLTAAFVLMVILSPLADRITRLGLPNAVASLIAIVLLIVIVAVAVATVLQPAFAMIAEAPQMIDRITHHFNDLRGSFDWVARLNKQLAQAAGHGTEKEVVVATPSVIEQVAFATPSLVLETLLTILMTFFMIEARVRLKRRLLLDRASFGASLKAARVVRDVQDHVSAYIVTVAAINLGVALIVLVGATLLGLVHPFMWAGLAFLLNFLPYIGPLTMVALLTFVGLGTSTTIASGLIPPLAFLALHGIESNAVTPSILGRRFTMNPVAILVAISYFSWVWGVIGALLSVPILITLFVLFENIGSPNLIGFVFGEPLFRGLLEETEVDYADQP